MDVGNMVRLVIAFLWTLCVAKCSPANDELDTVKGWMPRPYHDRKIMQLVEEQLMKLFGLNRKVNPRETLHVPDHMWTMYRKWSGEIHDDTDKEANVVRIVHHDETADSHGNDALAFNVRDIPTTETIRKAELHLFKRENAKETSGKARLHAQWLKASSPRIRRSLVEERHLSNSSSEWEKFDVTWIVKEWLKTPSRKNAFMLTTNEEQFSDADAIIIGSKPVDMSVVEWERRRPFLSIESREVSMKRQRRVARSIIGSRAGRRGSGSGRGGGRGGGRYGNKNRARKMHEKAKVEMCRRRNYYLDFQRINWSKQIISPMGFEMYYCQGTCPKPLGPHMNTTNHAVIQNQVNSFDPTLVPPPCCVPTSLGDQSFLYINLNNQIVMKTYSDIVVEGCGCR